MKKIYSLLFYLVCAGGLQAQTILENNPASLKWYQINTEHFKVVFPKGFEFQGQRMANTLEHIHDPEARTMGGKARKISVVLQNQSSVSNAFVSITPRRSEFYAMPSQNYNFLGTNDWLNMLASHEYRHVVQYQHSTRGFNRLFYYLFGSNTLAALSYVAAPQWFWEGDAVATETAFTHSGRGRIPYFGLVFKTNLMEGRTFNYHKQYLRSYKNNIPDHYVLGYHMISYLRKRTNDPQIWNKITARSWNVPFIPFAFSNAIKKETGLYVTQLYKAMAADLKQDWQNELDKLDLTSFETVNHRKGKAYTDYLYPQALEDGSVLIMKKGISDIEQFVTINNGTEKKVFTPGYINDTGMLSAAKSKVVWTEYGYDPRWRVKNFSLLKVYDFAAGKKWVIGSRHERYAGASLSPDAEKVVTVRTDNNYKNTLVVLDVFNGKVLKEFPNPENYFLAMPRWSDDGASIAVLKNAPTGKTISIVNYESGASADVLPVSQENVGYPNVYGRYLLYNSPVTGIDNIYALDLQTNNKYQITSSKYGAYNPMLSPDGKTLYYNDQSRDGLNVVSTSFNPASWQPADTKTDDQKELSDYLAEQEGRPGLLDTIPQTQLTVKRYSKFKNIINPYSWGGYYTNTLAQANVGITSQDILSTTAINLGYQYDINEKTGSWLAGISYQGWFPILDFNVTTGNRQQKTGVFGRDVKFNWKETGASAGFRIPLLLTRSKYYTSLQLGNAFGLTSISSFKNEVTQNGKVISSGNERYVPANDSVYFVFNDRVSNGTLLYNQATLSYVHSLKQSRRDFNPRWAQFIDFEHYSTPYGGDFNGRLWVARGSLYFPGAFKHQSFYFRGGYQSALSSFDLNNYAFRNRVYKPRGYSYPRDSKFYTLSANYSLPIWYPDINIGPLLNIQRIKANVFYDYGQGSGRSYFYYQVDLNNGNIGGRIPYLDNAAIYKSAGVELTFDINVIRFLPQLEVGLRSTYIQANAFNKSGMMFEILLGNIPF